MQFVTHKVATADVRRITYAGHEYLVVPTVMIRAGVLNGEYVPAEELAKFPEAWNGRPIPLAHPEQDGRHVSANSPEIYAQAVIGQIWNTQANGKLKAEMWIDLAKAEELGGDALEAVRRFEAGEPVEISTAYFRDIEPIQGTFGDQPYQGIARNIRPDHLAILLHEQGACSWDDGCGAPRVNSEDVELALNGALVANFVGSPRNPYGSHASFGYPGGRDAWKRAWRIYLSQVGGGKTTPDAMKSLRGTVRRIAMIAAGMKGSCRIPSSDGITPRKGPKSPLKGTHKGKPSDYGMTRWKKPSDDNVDREKALKLTCQDLQDLKRLVSAEIKRRIADRERTQGNADDEQGMQTNLSRRTWTEEQARKWLKRNEFTDANMDKTANFFAFRQASPQGFDDFRTEIAPFNFDPADGVVVVFGIKTRNGERVSQVQSIKFYHGEEDMEARPAIRSNEGALSALKEALRYLVYGPESERTVRNQVDEKEQLIEQIVANEKAGWEEGDLVDLDLCMLKKIAAMAEPAAGQPDPAPEAVAAEEPAEPEPVEDSLLTELRDLLPQFKSIVETVTANEAAERARLVAELAANERCAFEQADLEAMSVAQLEKLSASLRPANFLGRGTPRAHRRVEGPPEPPAILLAGRQQTETREAA